MQCPKCPSVMEEKTLSTLNGDVTVDRCKECRGIWFDLGEAEALREKWMSEFIDSGDPKIGKTYDEVRDIQCPRCDKRMEKLNDPVQTHIQYEGCADCGMYFDAGEFTDYKYETLMDVFRDFVYLVKNRGVSQ
ncbi:MAG: zf-TFIIB domain-containing protein [Pseudomonadales bacterium]|nr:zf-TFIIB domain-containing protein [Pseudomonadales bacterium]